MEKDLQRVGFLLQASSYEKIGRLEIFVKKQRRGWFARHANKTLHFKCISLSYILPIQIPPPLQSLPSVTQQYYSQINMSLKPISLPFLFAIFAALAMYKNLPLPNNPTFVKHLIHLSLNSFSSSPLVSTSMVDDSRRLHRRKHHEDSDIGSICDNFPPDFPPPDTNTTSILCVDRNGCCNFTTVQAAVDAVSILSQKRNIIWINSGVY